jgi:hypothetical protein
MAFSLPNAPYKSDWAQPMPDFGEALNKGIKRGFEPRAQAEELLGSMLKNKNEGIKSKYAEDLAKSTLALQAAQAEKARREPAPVLNNLEKAQAGYERAVALHGENSDAARDAKAYLTRIANGANGISVSYDPETGQPLVQIGGSGGRGQGGKLLTNPATGETYSQPTSAVATNLQNRIIGEEQLQPILEDIMQKVPQFQSGWTRIASELEGIANEWAPKSWGVDFRLPSEHAGGTAALSKSAESMLKLYGLHANARNVQEVKNIITPEKGESAAGYKARVAEELEKYALSKRTAQSQLGHGVKVTEGNIAGNNKKLQWADIRHTAQKRGLTENQVIEKLAAKSGKTVEQLMKQIEVEHS